MMFSFLFLLILEAMPIVFGTSCFGISICSSNIKNVFHELTSHKAPSIQYECKQKCLRFAFLALKINDSNYKLEPVT